MRKLEPPLSFYAVNVYKFCIHSIGNKSIELKNRLVAITDDIESAALEYERSFANNTLYIIAPDNSKKETKFFGEVTKKELLDVYTEQLVPQGMNRPEYIGE